MVRHSISHSITDYYDLSQELLEARVRTSRQQLWITVLCGLTLVLAIIILVMRRISKSRRQLNEKVMLAESLVLELKDNKDKYVRMSSTLREILKPTGAFIDEVSGLLYEFEQETEQDGEVQVDELTYNESKQGSAERSVKGDRKIAQAVGGLIGRLSNDRQQLALLEREIDLAYDNLMSDFRKDVPGMKEMDYSVFLFSVLGLGYSTMSVLLKGETREQLYQRRRRIKMKVRSLPPERQAHYLSFLGSSKRNKT